MKILRFLAPTEKKKHNKIKSTSQSEKRAVQQEKSRGGFEVTHIINWFKVPEFWSWRNATQSP